MKWIAASLREVSPLGLALLFCAFFLNLWGPPLFDLDEGAFSAATREMLARGDFITTWLNGEPRFDKPILIYWLQALSVSLGNADEFFFRLPSALAATAWGLCLFSFAREQFGLQKARYTLVFFCSCITVVIIGRAATADALLNLFIALTLMDAWRHLDSGRSAPLYRAYLWIGLGLLTKGPVAAVVPFMTLSVFALVQRDFSAWKRLAWRPLGWVITLAVAAPWYIAEYLDQGQAFIDGFILQHNLERFSDTMESHGGSVFYYLPVLLLMFLPFTAWLWGALTSVREFRRDRFTCWCWVWFAFVLLFFSLSGTQLPHYVLYGSTPVFLLMASHSGRLASLWWAVVPAVLLVLLWLLLPSVAGQVYQSTDDPYLSAVLENANQFFGWGYYIAMGAVLVAILAMPLLRFGRLRSLQLIGLMHVLLLVLFVIPLVAELRQQPVKEAAQVARQLDEQVLMWRHDMPSFSTYLGEVTPKRAPRPGELVFTRVGKFPPESLDLLYAERGILLGRYLGGEVP